MMRFQHGPALPATVALPLLAGAVVAIEAGYRRVPAGGAVLSVLTAMVLALAVVVPLASRCPASRDVTLAMPRLLAPEERRTLRRTTVLCPAVYRSRRDGRDECLVSDGDGGASVGCG
ncbi:hypothetical protein [Stenotrophomonas acidaminiphila]|uniref:hypothetical protein n=1 Tax=Stenotrophomonas acidaminiphila TaxID=128780 RepID=UPI0020C73190|nr:hypothetical protein [Stenotrophomonas acidaminiphila]